MEKSILDSVSSISDYITSIVSMVVALCFRGVIPAFAWRD
jgi:hypothetical protein